METPTTKPVLPNAFALFKPSASAFMVNVWTFLALFFLPLAGFLVLIPMGMVGTDSSAAGVMAILLIVAIGLFYILLAPAVPYVQLQSARGQQVTLSEAWKTSLKYFWRFWGVGLLTGLIVLAGLILLIVPGFFMIKRYMLTPFYIYDKDMGVMEAMRASAADAKMFSGAIWGILGVNILIQLPGVFPLLGLVSMILSITYYCAPAIRYDQIKAAKLSMPAPTPPPAATPAAEA